MSVPRTVFFGYGSEPETARETLHAASRLIADTGMVTVRSWEDMMVNGRVIITQIREEIDGSDVAAFDVTSLNENVLFELGYSIARGRKIWICLDRTDQDALSRWKQFQLLSTIGYSGWANSYNLRDNFLRDRPDEKERSLYDDLIEPTLEPQIPGTIFNFASFHATEASIRIERRLSSEERRGVGVVTADLTESSVNTLTWYAQKVYETDATIVHFMAPRRELSQLHNPRMAIVAGMAAGFERRLLMLAEEDYSGPIDYMDELRIYNSPSQCDAYVAEWLSGLALAPSSKRKLRLATELRQLRFGEHVAENEADVLAEYFVETAAFEQVISGRNTLFVGRKGAGKTANMLQAALRLREDVRNLVVVIKPQSYELEGLISLLVHLPREAKSYTLLSLWNFLLQSEIARTAIEVVESRPRAVPRTAAEESLISFVDETDFGLREEFSVRFERTVLALEQSGIVQSSSGSERRDLLNEALHAKAIKVLRNRIGAVLKDRNRVAVLIDNLDKAWDRQADLDAVSDLLLGLLTAVGRVEIEYGKEDFWRNRVSLSLATFLRSDIYAYLQRKAREPDKIPTNTLSWSDPKQLMRVVEQRFVAARGRQADPNELWERFFCSSVAGRPLQEYLQWRVLPRPRDIVYLCNSAVMAAVNSKNDRVSARDLMQAERDYSQFAFEALLVENGITIGELEDVLLEFAGGTAVVSERQALQAIASAVHDSSKTKNVLERLLAVSFFGRVVGQNRFLYPEVGPESKKADVLSRKFAESSGSDRLFVIHPAYRPYLEIDDNT